MNYRAVPWQRNIRKIPQHIRTELTEINSELVVVAATKKVARADIAGGLYDHVGLSSLEGDIVAGSSMLPPDDAGKWSQRNLHGWDRKRDDLPKVTKSYVREVPNWGDAIRNGTHMHTWSREVYQRQVFEPQGMTISADILADHGGDYISVRFSLAPMLDRTESEFELMLLWSLNVLQENTGVAGVFSADATREDYAKTILIDWEIFPPGTADEVIGRLLRRPARQHNAPDFDGPIADRVRFFERLNPTAYIRGQGSFGSYFGAQFADDLVVFENLKYGNAIYVLYEDWRDISRRSRIDLLRDKDANFDRIIHSDNWKKEIKELLEVKLAERGLGNRRGRGLFR